jgi:hypothetical protein
MSLQGFTQIFLFWYFVARYIFLLYQLAFYVQNVKNMTALLGYFFRKSVQIRLTKNKASNRKNVKSRKKIVQRLAIYQSFAKKSIK